ncbi:Fic family protein, partial [Mesorhizobium sp. M3A.F.Ca.ET.201.01.1.1]
KSFETRDEQEVAGYAQVMETIFSHFDAIDLTENHVMQLHRDLLAFSNKDERHRGAYKTLANNVSAFDADGKEIGVIFETATPFDTPKRMKELIEWTRRTLN